MPPPEEQALVPGVTVKVAVAPPEGLVMVYVLSEEPQVNEVWMGPVSGMLMVSLSEELIFNVCPADIVKLKLSPLTVIEFRTASLPVTFQFLLFTLIMDVSALRVTSPTAEAKAKGASRSTAKTFKYIFISN